MWLDGAHRLRSINAQVVQDFEDMILRQGFSSRKNNRTIEADIQKQLDEDRKFENETNPIFVELEKAKNAPVKPHDKNAPQVQET